eukprot:TRINITY_DN3705_c0_g1_i1.p1 TRINITY_DN3705_c0_g1~~TRINITY_DN3705_c0_g1_i1.p1  ORF type:complete len:622 (+),score=154.29 TRINITY_DN3705_c0_g1_i1:147-1868(+)
MARAVAHVGRQGFAAPGALLGAILVSQVAHVCLSEAVAAPRAATRVNPHSCALAVALAAAAPGFTAALAGPAFLAHVEGLDRPEPAQELASALQVGVLDAADAEAEDEAEEPEPEENKVDESEPVTEAEDEAEEPEPEENEDKADEPEPVTEADGHDFSGAAETEQLLAADGPRRRHDVQPDDAARPTGRDGDFRAGIGDEVFDLDESLARDENHYKRVWNVIRDVERHKRRARRKVEKDGVRAFFSSAVFYEWMVFVVAMVVFVPLFMRMQKWPSSPHHHVLGLLVWLMMGLMYNLAVAARLGREPGIQWFTGYLLELIFSIENVFIFHIVAKSFRTPQQTTRKALFVVIVCQILFEMVFFMGLADRVRSMQALPYCLGCWLLYVGYHAGKEDGHSSSTDVRESAIFRASAWMLGGRLSQTYEDCGSVFVIKGGRLCVSLVFPFLISMLAVDFFLEVDVTLTKIEELPNQYIAFTSSAVAAFAMPELFFVARDLFKRYRLLKYGVSFVLVFFGVQMLGHRIYTLPDLAGCAIIIVVMVFCMLASDLERKQLPAHKKALEDPAHLTDDEGYVA